MPSTTGPRSRLCIHAYAMGAHWKSVEAIEDLPYADLTDESNRQLYRNAPEDFFSLYANSTTIVNAHLFGSFSEQAAAYLAEHLGSKIVAAGRFSQTELEHSRQLGQRFGVDVVTERHPEPRLFKACINHQRIESFVPTAGFSSDSEAFAACLAPGYGVRGAQHWTQLWKSDVTSPALEAGIRKRDAFYAVARELARKTARPLNRSMIGQHEHVPGVTVREWIDLLEKLCALETVPAVNLKPLRRTLDRPKLYWRHPGFGLWLSGEMLNPNHDLCRALFENAVYLALKDAYPQARILHFQDTNHVTCPLIVEHDNLYQAYYICENATEKLACMRHHKSLVKTGRFMPQAGIIDSVAMTVPAKVCYEDVGATAISRIPTEQQRNNNV